MQTKNFYQHPTASQFRRGLKIPAALVTLLTLGACSVETRPPNADVLTPLNRKWLKSQKC
jgi:hypothetical protein